MFLSNRAQNLLMIAFLAGILLLLAPIAVRPQYQIESWTTDNGLPQNTVRSILQTPDGYLWMTTLDGLARFDGVRFTIYNKLNTENFGANRLSQLTQSPDGDLWISGESDFVIRRRAGKFETYALTTGSERINGIRNLVLDSQGVPVVSSQAGIFRWNGEKFIAYTPVAGEVKDGYIMWGKSGAFWYTIKNVLYRLKDNRISSFELPGGEIKGQIVKIFEDSRGRLWCGTYEGLFVVENDELKWYTTADGLPGDDNKPVAEDRDGNIWVVTPNGAVSIAPDGKINVVTNAQGLSESFTATVFQDREGSIWIGTFRKGLNRLTLRTIQFYSTKDGLASPVVRPIYQMMNGDILLGGDDLTLWHDGVFSRFNIEKDGVTAIGEDAGGRLWLGGWNDVFSLENGKRRGWLKSFTEKTTVTAIHQQRGGPLWLATDSGLYILQNDVMRRMTTADGLVSNDVRVILESPKGSLWFGTYGGVSKFKDGRFVSYTTADGLANDQVRSLYEDSDGTLWIGSYDGGLTRLKDEKFTRYTSKDGLFNDGVFQILEDAAGNFWMSSNRGIYRVAKQQLNDFADGKINRIHSIAYGKVDGLLETECNGGQQPAGIKASDGRLWFPTQNGVAVIDPEKIKVNPIPPPVEIETAAVDNKAVGVNETINIAPGENNLQINYTGLSFIKPEFVNFRYRLEGLDKDWVEAGGRRTAYYSYLPPGDYTFQVIAANSDGVWNTEGRHLKIRVVPPFYRTWWFLILSLGIIFGGVYFGYRQRIDRLEANRRVQESFSRELLSSQESERQRIAAELHDGLGQSLLVIKNRALLGTMSPDDKTEAQEQFEEISRASSQAIEEVREIAYNLRPYHLDRLGLTQSIKAMLDALNDSTKIEFAYDIMPLENIFAKDEEVIVYRIVQECVNNIVKHSEATEASIVIYQSHNGLTMTIEDNGRGFVPYQSNQTRGGFGLIGLEERVKILGGAMQIRSEPDGGTTIIIKELAKNSREV